MSINSISKSMISALLVATTAAVYCACYAQAASQLEKSWAHTQSSGSDNLDANRYWLAEPQLKEALSIAQASGFKDLRLARSYGELGRLYTVRGKFADAEPLLEKELSVKEDYLGMADGRIIPAMGSLVIFYLNYGFKRKAYPLTDELLDLIDGKLSEPMASRGTKVKFQKGMTLEAWAGTAEMAARDPLLEWAITCDKLGDAYRNVGDYPMAERVFKAGLDLKTTVLGQGHLSLANSYDNLGMVCMAQKQYAQSSAFFNDSLEITEKIQPAEHPEVYSRLDKLAKSLIDAGKYQEAEALYLRAQDLWKKEPSKHDGEARCLYALGSLYILEKKYAAGAALLHRALRLKESFDGTCSIGLVPYLLRYAYAMYYLGRRSESACLAARARSISPPEKPVEPLVATAGFRSDKPGTGKDDTETTAHTVAKKHVKKARTRRSAGHSRRRSH